MDSVNLIWKHGTILICLLSIYQTGCGRLSHQADVESSFAQDVIGLFKRHDLESQSTVTNLSQILHFAKHGYPYFQHRQISQFGKHAGFTNSLAEKYTFFWPRFTHEHLQGKVICMSAQPFPSHGNVLSRIYIADRDGNYIFRTVSETTAQKVLNEIKPNVVPLPNILPVPPPPQEVQASWNLTLRQRYEKFVWNLSRALGQDSSDPVRIGLAFGTVLIVAGLLWVVILFWRGRR